MSHPRHLYRYKCPLKRLSRIDFARRAYGFELLTFRGTISGDVVSLITFARVVSNMLSLLANKKKKLVLYFFTCLFHGIRSHL